MENPSPAPRKKTPNSENARWACLIIFIVAVGAALLYVSSEKHSTGTIVLLGAVLLVGQICAMLPWIISAKQAAGTNQANATLADKLDSCMAKSFANQEIIHNEIHETAKTLSKRIDEVASSTRPSELTDLDIAKIAEILASKVIAGTPKVELPDVEEITTTLSEEIQKIDESIKQVSEEFSRMLEEQVAAIQARIDTVKPEPVNLKALNERLDTLALNQENILEKLELLEILPEDDLDEEEADENVADLDEETTESETLPVPEDDANFPLPENMFAQAQAANATAGTAVEKMIAENAPTAEEENLPEETEKPTSQEEIFAEQSPEITNSSEDSKEEEPEAATTPATPEGELPLIEDLPHTALILKAEFRPGEKPFLRGKAPGLSPKKSTPMDYSGNGRWRFDFGPMKESAEIIIFRNDTNEALGDPFMLPAGKVTTLAFDPAK